MTISDGYVPTNDQKNVFRPMRNALNAWNRTPTASMTAIIHGRPASESGNRHSHDMRIQEAATDHPRCVVSHRPRASQPKRRVLMTSAKACPDLHSGELIFMTPDTP